MRAFEALGGDPALVHHDHPVGIARGRVEIVDRDQGSAGSPGADLVANQLHQPDLPERIEIGGRLVEQQQLRSRRQRAGDQHPAALAGRQPVHPPVEQAVQFQGGEGRFAAAQARSGRGRASGQGTSRVAGR